MNPLVASSVREYQRSLTALQGGTGAVVALAGDEIWLRQADATGPDRHPCPARGGYRDRSVRRQLFRLSPDRGLSVRLQAERADLRPGSWQLSGVKRWRMSDLNPEAQATTLPSLGIASDLTPRRFATVLHRRARYRCSSFPLHRDAGAGGVFGAGTPDAPAYGTGASAVADRHDVVGAGAEHTSCAGRRGWNSGACHDSLWIYPVLFA